MTITPRDEFRIRRSVHADAAEICRVHIASIRALCAARYTPGEIEAWAGWKKPENYDVPIRTTDFYVAEERPAPVTPQPGGGTREDPWRIVGFGSLSVPKAEITGLYFHPDAIGKGVGAAMMRRLFELARAAGLRELVVGSTLNAEPFYARMGFVREAETFHEFPSGIRVASVRMRLREIPQGSPATSHARPASRAAP
jgi:putative acetyltransferase